MAQGTKEVRFHGGVCVIVCALFAAATPLFSTEPDKWPVIGLFALAPILALATWRLHFSKLAGVICFTELLTFVCVVRFYMYRGNRGAYCALGIAACVIVLTAALARTVVDDEAFKFGLADAVKELRNAPHTMVWILFLLFVQVAYLLALAVGIHDRATGGRALIRTQENAKYADAERSDIGVDTTFIIRHLAGCPGDGCTPSEIPMTVATDQQLMENLKTTKEEDPNRIRLVREFLARKDSLQTHARLNDDEVSLIAENALVLAKLRQTVIDECKDASRPCALVVRGHVTDHLSRKEKAIAENDDLADRRSESVHQLLGKNFLGMRLTCTVSAVGNSDNSFLSQNRDSFPPNWDHKLATEIRLLQKPKSLALLDYLYFMIYTITTTGYGDLVPADRFTQFVVSIANLYEMFFVVIVLNVLTKQRDDGSSRGPAKAPEAAGAAPRIVGSSND